MISRRDFRITRTNMPIGNLLFIVTAAVLAALSSGCSHVQEPQMMLIKGGCFDMGDMFHEGDADEQFVHRVCLDDFYIGVYEVTQDQWQRVMGDNPATFGKGGSFPIETVSWYDAQDFIRQLNLETEKKYRLPTEAEWEYAARARGKKVRFGTGTDRVGPAIANFESRSGFVKFYSEAGPPLDAPTRVGSFTSNGLGLYDMTGNVWEWIADAYDAGYYRDSLTKNPKGPASGEYHVIRGGSWGTPPKYLRVSNRNRLRPVIRVYNVGLRLAMSVPKTP